MYTEAQIESAWKKLNEDTRKHEEEGGPLPIPTSITEGFKDLGKSPTFMRVALTSSVLDRTGFTLAMAACSLLHVLQTPETVPDSPHKPV